MRKEKFRIYYSDGSVVKGRNRTHWRKAPVHGVQVVVDMRPPPNRPFATWTPWEGANPNRQIWTGEDVYRLYPSYPRKFGEWISDEAYERIWRRAFTED